MATLFLYNSHRERPGYLAGLTKVQTDFEIKFQYIDTFVKKEYNSRRNSPGGKCRRAGFTKEDYRMKKFLALSLAVLMLVSLLTACGGAASSAPASTPASGASSTAGAEDTITVLVPPVTNDYLEKMTEWAAEFHEMYPNLTMEVIGTSWDDHNTKLSTMANAGEAPDIAEMSYAAIGTYVENGTALNLSEVMDPTLLADFDQNALDYMTIAGNVYGLPLYITIQALGANKDMLAAAGVDVAKVQSSGWTYEEFMTAIKAGTTKDCFGFVFANSGVTASDFLTIFGVSAGLNNAFTSDLKYAYTSTKMLDLLKAVEEMTASGYMPNYGVEASQRMVMCETGNAMIFGKAMPLFEINITKNNAALEANDGTAVENSIPVNYAFLPVPTMEGVTETCFGSVDGLVAFRNQNTSEEHTQNVMKALYFLSSGERAAYVDAATCLDGVSKTSREALATMDVGERDQGNIDCAARMITTVIAPPTGITAEQSATAQQIMDEVIVPKFQALLAGEVTAQAMYDEIVSKGTAAFGEANCDLT